MAELLLSVQELSCGFGGPPLFEGLSFGLFQGDHVGLVGPNGSGKTTLLRMLAGLDPPTSGIRSPRKHLRIGYVPQDPRFAATATVAGVLREAAQAPGLEPHQVDTRVSLAAGRAGFADAEQPVAALSGGWRKRLAIARELAREPELLLLDEPTNHLDVEGILWLEGVLGQVPEAFLAVSHDRYFLESVARRVIELNRVYPSGMFDVAGRYSRFLEKKDELLQGQASYRDSLRSRVRDELEWLSRKAKARTRKAQARIDEAGRLRRELADLDERSRRSEVAIDFAGSERRTRRLLVAEELSKSFGERSLVSGLELVLSPGHRLGLLGANGSGKSTLLKLLAGSLEPDAGSVTHADALQVVVFDQHRSRLDPALSLRRSLAPSGDAVMHRGRQQHVAGWAQRFLFRSDQLDTPVGQLSGGEQARVLIARLMLEPADLLLLDEPTNDLDIPTLEVLEESLLEFPGALVLVSHDRYLLDRVCNRLLALDGEGGVLPYADYAQWEAAEQEAASAASASDAAPRAEPAPRRRRAQGGKKLSWREQREWEEMERRILEAEGVLESCQAAAADPAIATDHVALGERSAALAEAQAEVERLYARWAELEAHQQG